MRGDAEQRYFSTEGSQRMLAKPFSEMIDEALHLLGRRRAWRECGIERPLWNRLSLQDFDQRTAAEVVAHRPVRQQRDPEACLRFRSTIRARRLGQAIS